MLDEHTRECLDGMVERSITGEHLIDELGRVAAERRQPWRNGYVESFNSRIRDECLKGTA